MSPPPLPSEDQQVEHCVVCGAEERHSGGEKGLNIVFFWYFQALKVKKVPPSLVLLLPVALEMSSVVMQKGQYLCQAHTPSIKVFSFLIYEESKTKESLSLQMEE